MRNVAVVVTILLLTMVARAADVEMERPHIVFLSESAASIACKSGSRRACTTVSTRFEHVADIRASLSEYGHSLALHSFPSEAACTSFINGEMKMFPHTMKLIQRLTTVKRDGIQFASTVPE